MERSGQWCGINAVAGNSSGLASGQTSSTTPLQQATGVGAKGEASHSCLIGQTICRLFRICEGFSCLLVGASLILRQGIHVQRTLAEYAPQRLLRALTVACQESCAVSYISVISPTPKLQKSRYQLGIQSVDDVDPRLRKSGTRVFVVLGLSATLRRANTLPTHLRSMRRSRARFIPMSASTFTVRKTPMPQSVFTD